MSNPDLRRSEMHEATPELFHWREYLNTPEQLAPELATKLDALEQLINEAGEFGEEFRRHLAAYHQPTLSLIGYCREMLTPEERSTLSRAVRDLGEISRFLRNLRKSQSDPPQ